MPPYSLEYYNYYQATKNDNIKNLKIVIMKLGFGFGCSYVFHFEIVMGIALDII